MIDPSVDFGSYKIPSKNIRKNRKVFYGLKKKRGELIEKWFDRVQSRINCCEFAKLTEILLIDKFFCELGNDELKSFQGSENWSLKQLNEYFFGQNIDTVRISSHLANTESDVDQCQMSPSEAVKYEIVSLAPMKICEICSKQKLIAFYFVELQEDSAYLQNESDNEIVVDEYLVGEQISHEKVEEKEEKRETEKLWQTDAPLDIQNENASVTEGEDFESNDTVTVGPIKYEFVSISK